MAIKDIYQSVINLDRESIVGHVQNELDKGTKASVILNEGLIAALDEVGDKFSSGEMFLPEMLAAAQAMKSGLEVIKPFLTDTESQSAGTVVIGTVKGDLHDIGKDLVVMMLEGAGFNVIDLGVDVDTETFIQAVKDNEADVVGLSALLTTTMPAMEATLSGLKESGISVKCIIGGSPVSQSFADEIGADGYSDDAPGAVRLVRKLVTD
jgi:5-methyltetrahydrofolate--homocysteine methyltransferase